MLKAWAVEGLKKARKLDARTEPELGHSRTQNSLTLQLNSIDFFHKKDCFTRGGGVGIYKVPKALYNYTK